MSEYLLVLLRTVICFVTLWGTTRLMGKRLISNLTLFDYITGITIGSIAANMVTSDDEWGPLLVGMIGWALLTYLSHRVTLEGRKINEVMEGKPTVLIRNGQILEKNLKSSLLNVQELMSMLRRKGYYTPAEIEYALLEVNGEVSVLPKSQYRPVQPHDLHVPTAYEGLTTQLVQERQVLHPNLQQLGLSEDWLREQFEAQGITGPYAVFSAWLDTQGRLIVDRYQDGDTEQPPPQ